MKMLTLRGLEELLRVLKATWPELKFSEFIDSVPKIKEIMVDDYPDD